MSDTPFQSDDINDEMRRQRFIKDEKIGKDEVEKIDPKSGDHTGLGKHKAK